MNKNKLSEKLKEGVSVQELEDFARKHTTEVFTALAIIVGAISSAWDFFTGPKMTILFTALGVLLGIFFPAPTEKGLKQLYGFTFKQEKSTQMILGGVKIIIGIFIPFILFGILGLLAGTSYHYYVRHAQATAGIHPTHSSRHKNDEEHD
ncbi:MAG: hypothetical protein JSS32_01550 [Verrucomicrobia bacterium]|nr:hypothetical protein [Verrucomicrobiota bacterium]